MKSFLIGLYIVLNRTIIVNTISNYLQNRKRKQYKRQSIENLKSTLTKITPKPKRNIKLQIKNKVPIKDHFKKISSKIKNNSSNTNKRHYIEIE